MATSQNTRLLEALLPVTAPIDGRSQADLLNFATRYSSLIRYFEADGRHSGNWASFYLGQPLALFAAIADVDLEEHRDFYSEWLRQLRGVSTVPTQGLPALASLEASSFRSTVSALVTTLRAVESWTRSFSTISDEVAYFKLARSQLDGPLRECREGLRVLCQAMEVASPTILQSVEIEEREWFPGQWRQESSIEPPVPAEQPPSSWSEFCDALERIVWRAHHSEATLVEIARNRLLVLLDAPGSLPPHFGLILAFIRQFGRVQARANEITGRHLDFYFREILNEKPRGPVPDRVFIAIESKAGERPFLLPAGTRVTSDASSNPGNPIVFLTEDPVEMGMYRIERQEAVRWHPPNWQHTLLAPGKPGPESVSSQGPVSPGPGTPDGEIWVEREVTLGFAVSSPCLVSAGGGRQITLQVTFLPANAVDATPLSTGEAPPPESSTAHSRPSDLRIIYSGPEGWFRVPDERLQQVAWTYFNGASPQPFSLAIVVILAAGDPPLCDFDPARMPGEFDPGAPVLQVLFPQSFPVLEDPPGMEPGAVTRAFASARLKSVDVALVVSDLDAPVLYNPTGRIAYGRPAPVFGNRPQVGSALLIGVPELFRKPSSEFTIHIVWQNLPDPNSFPFGFRSYYREYIQMADKAGLLDPSEVGFAALCDASALFQLGEYRVSLSALAGRQWIDCPLADGASTALFLADDSGKIKPATVIRTASGTPVLSEPPTGPPPDLNFGPHSTTGFLRLTLSGPSYAFGHLAYPRVASAVATYNSRFGTRTTSAGQPIVDQIRVTHPRSWLGRVLSPLSGPAYFTLPKDLFAALRRAGAPPAEIQARAQQIHLPIPELVDRLLHLDGTVFSKDASLDEQVIRALRLERAQLEDKDRDRLLVLIYSWFRQLLEQQKEIRALVQALRVIHSRSHWKWIVHLWSATPVYSLPDDLFPILARKPEVPPALHQLLDKLGIRSPGYPNLLSVLKGRTFSTEEELNVRLLKALSVTHRRPPAADLNRLLHLTYSWFIELIQSNLPLSEDGISPGLLPDPPMPMPNPPLHPTASRVSLGYRARTTVEASTRSPRDCAYHVHPFRTTRVDWSPDSASTLVPDWLGGTWAYLGLRIARCPASISFLVLPPSCPHPSPPDSNTSSREPSWSIYRMNGWQRLDPDLIHDGTLGLRRPGLVHLKIPSSPAELTNDSPDGLLWLRIRFSNPEQSLTGFQVLPQAVVASRSPSPPVASASPSTSPTPPMDLPPETLQQLSPADARVTRVRQPLASFGGRARESDLDFHIRISERLRHKGRAWTAWDYERLVLQEFPEVFFVDCVLSEPGSVFLVLIPTLKQPPSVLPPQLDPSRLAAVENWIRRRASPHVTVRATNPSYRRVQINAEVALASGTPGAALLDRLDQDLKEHLSPWVYRQSSIRLPSQFINSTEVLHFIQSRPYVRGVSHFSLSLSAPHQPVKLGTIPEPTAATARVAAPGPAEMLLTADHHLLRSV